LTLKRRAIAWESPRQKNWIRLFCGETGRVRYNFGPQLPAMRQISLRPASAEDRGKGKRDQLILLDGYPIGANENLHALWLPPVLIKLIAEHEGDHGEGSDAKKKHVAAIHDFDLENESVSRRFLSRRAMAGQPGLQVAA
jgi:hypothetical protein